MARSPHQAAYKIQQHPSFGRPVPKQQGHVLALRTRLCQNYPMRKAPSLKAKPSTELRNWSFDTNAPLVEGIRIRQRGSPQRERDEFSIGCKLLPVFGRCAIERVTEH